MGVKITGLEEFQRKLEEVQHALRSLDGHIASLKFDPTDPKSVEAAIREMEAAVDRKIDPYSGNEIVAGLAQTSKARFRDQILKRVNPSKR